MSSLEVSLIIIYATAFVFVILKTNLFSSAFVSKRFIIFIFLLKIIVAYLYAYIHFINDWKDTFHIFLSAKGISALFVNHPDIYFKFILGNIDAPFSEEIKSLVGEKTLKIYRQPRTGFIMRLSALLIPLSYGFYSVQCVFFSFLSTFGLFSIYNFIVNKINYNHRLLKLFLFFAPSLLFWLSGMHKDGMTVFSLGLILFSIDKLRMKKWIYLLLLIIGVSFSFKIRDYALLLFVPALIAYIITSEFKLKNLIGYTLIYGIGIIFFFGAKLISPKYDFPNKFVSYQKAFVKLKGESNFDVVILEPTVESFTTSVPIALFNTIFKPSFKTTHTFWALLAAIENAIYVLLAVLMLCFLNLKRLDRLQHSVVLFFLFFGLSYFLTLGLVVDNIGAIVRYKTTPMVFLGSIIIILFDADKFKRFFTFSK